MEYEIQVRRELKGYIERGTKTVELRPNVAPYSLYKVGDVLVVRGITKPLPPIIDIREYPDVRDAMLTEDSYKIAPLFSVNQIVSYFGGLYNGAALSNGILAIEWSIPTR